MRCGRPCDAAVLLEDEHSEILPCGWQQLQFSIKYIHYHFFYYIAVSIFDTVGNYTGWSRKVNPTEITKTLY